MIKLIGTFTRVALLLAVLTLSACGLSPTITDTAQVVAPDNAENPPTGADEASEVQVAASSAGLGTIVYKGNTRTKGCKKQRRTGSHLFRVDCADPDSGSQPVRSGTYMDLGHLTMSGSVRPEN